MTFIIIWSKFFYVTSIHHYLKQDFSLVMFSKAPMVQLSFLCINNLVHAVLYWLLLLDFLLITFLLTSHVSDSMSLWVCLKVNCWKYRKFKFNTLPISSMLTTVKHFMGINFRYFSVADPENINYCPTTMFPLCLYVTYDIGLASLFSF